MHFISQIKQSDNQKFVGGGYFIAIQSKNWEEKSSYDKNMEEKRTHN